jgi:hypothetical protein
MRRSLMFLLGLTCCLMTACSSDKMRVIVESDPKVNGGRSLYVLARRVERSTWEAEKESPETVGKKVFAVPADPTVIKSQPLIPGTPFEMEFKIPNDVPVAIYFLFTDESERWTVFFEIPIPEDLEVTLKKSAIVATDY